MSEDIKQWVCMCEGVIRLCLLKKSWMMRIGMRDRNSNYFSLLPYLHSNTPFLSSLCFTHVSHQSTSSKASQHGQKGDREWEMGWEVRGGADGWVKWNAQKGLKWWTEYVHSAQYNASALWLMSCESRFMWFVIPSRITIFLTFSITHQSDCNTLWMWLGRNEERVATIGD